MFVTSLDVGTIKADSADKYECSPSPGKTAVARVHVITEGKLSKQESTDKIHMIFFHSANFWNTHQTTNKIESFSSFSFCGFKLDKSVINFNIILTTKSRL